MKGTGQTANVSYISFIVIWPGFDSIARLIPAALQRDMVYDEQKSTFKVFICEKTLDELLEAQIDV